ncbi:MAG: TerB family tellurite resistance protein [Pseudomonadota bacterium]
MTERPVFDAFKKLLGQTEPKRDTAVDPHEAAVALMVEAALSDGIYANLESDMIAEILIESFGFDAARTDTLMQRGELLAEEAIGAHQFTKLVKTLPQTERIAVIEGLYRVALADGDKCKFEEAYIRHVASLLHVDDVNRANARKRAETRIQTL